MKRKFLTLMMMAVIVSFNAHAQLTLGSGDSKEKEVNVVAGDPNIPPTVEQVTRLFQQEEYYVIHASVPKILVNPEPAIKSAVIALAESGIIETGFNETRTIYKMTPNETTNKLLLRTSAEYYVLAAGLAQFAGISKLVMGDRPGTYKAELSVTLTMESTISHVFGVKTGHITTQEVEIIYDIVSGGWIPSESYTEGNISPYRMSQYGRNSVRALKYYTKVQEGELLGVWENKKGRLTITEDHFGWEKWNKKQEIYEPKCSGPYKFDLDGRMVLVDCKKSTAEWEIKIPRIAGTINMHWIGAYSYGTHTWYKHFTEEDQTNLYYQLIEGEWLLVHLGGTDTYTFNEDGTYKAVKPDGKVKNGKYGFDVKHQTIIFDNTSGGRLLSIGPGFFSIGVQDKTGTTQKAEIFTKKG